MSVVTQDLLTDDDTPEEIFDDSSNCYIVSEESEDSEEEYIPKIKSRRKYVRKQNYNKKQNTEENIECVDTPSEDESELDEVDQRKSKSSEGKNDKRHNNGRVKAVDKGNAVQKMEKIEFRSIIRYLYIKGKTATEIYKSLRDTYADAAPSYDTVVRWRRHFRAGSKLLSDKPRCGRPSFVDNEAILREVEQCLHEDNRMTIHAIMCKVNLGYGTVWKIIHDELHMRKEDECWVRRDDTTSDERED